jgi:squalene-hopene/tetraprenyl-beta-curcumene cyclase
MKMFAALLLALAPTAFAGDPAGWDRAAALRHLDERAQAWLDFPGAYRGQGATRTTCLSCHSFVPYLLARSTTGDIPAAPRAKSLDQIRERVAHWSELDTPAWKLPYDHSAEKKRQSRGTEAVLNALILASDDGACGLCEQSPTTKTALDHLWSTQRADGPDAGSWDWLDFGLEPWEAGDGRFFGATLAARALGTAPGYDLKSADVLPKVDRLRAYLHSHTSDQGLFNRVALLRASADLGGLLTDPERTKLVDEILKAQRPDGGWSLASLGDYERSDGTPEDKDSDGLATGFVVDALRASGLPRSHPAVAKGLDWLRGHQQKDGGWITVSLNKKRDPKSHVGQFMSDAATAYAVLALTRDEPAPTPK